MVEEAGGERVTYLRHKQARGGKNLRMGIPRAVGDRRTAYGLSGVPTPILPPTPRCLEAHSGMSAEEAERRALGTHHPHKHAHTDPHTELSSAERETEPTTRARVVPSSRSASEGGRQEAESGEGLPFVRCFLLFWG